MQEWRQKELIDNIFNEIKNKFPQVELGHIDYNPEETWIQLLIPEELDGDEELDNLLARRYTDILMEYGIGIEFHTRLNKKTKIIA